MVDSEHSMMHPPVLFFQHEPCVFERQKRTSLGTDDRSPTYPFEADIDLGNGRRIDQRSAFIVEGDWIDDRQEDHSDRRYISFVESASWLFASKVATTPYLVKNCSRVCLIPNSTSPANLGPIGTLMA